MAGAAHTDVAAYVLGVLDDAENAAFEAHLLDCPHCQLDLLELYELPDVLDRIRQRWPEPPAPEPGPRVLEGLLGEVAATRRRRRRIARVAGVAAALLVLAGPLVTLAVSAPDPGVPLPRAEAPVASVAGTSVPPPGEVDLFRPTEADAAASAEVAVRATEWGSAVELRLGGVTGPLRCVLVAIERDGTTHVAAGWTVPEEGYGVPGSPEPLRIVGGAGLTPAQIARFEVRTDTGTVLATVAR
ncbi:putative zinc finger protein [Prauserella shujinwangii]|uniref:Putative zinc finger protein n=1 Tax=Prauserella shujinwangii TaxID=1453103 RepID=A0A2T0M3I7_9PSEU|nr:zf-HC2 domain-containing protein [Prauserella shujinwangii]PRX51297.1 putative zinc finger protein [Prauserella shujinwangii]